MLNLYLLKNLWKPAFKIFYFVHSWILCPWCSWKFQPLRDKLLNTFLFIAWHTYYCMNTEQKKSKHYKSKTCQKITWLLLLRDCLHLLERYLISATDQRENKSWQTITTSTYQRRVNQIPQNSAASPCCSYRRNWHQLAGRTNI